MGHWEDGDRHEMWGEVFHTRVWVEDPEDEEEVDERNMCTVCGQNVQMGEPRMVLGRKEYPHFYCEECYNEMKDEIEKIIQHWTESTGATADDALEMMCDVIEVL